MTISFDRHTGLAALVLLAGLVLPVLFGSSVSCAEGEGPSVRMAVDPTVLPPVQPPDEAVEAPPAAVPGARDGEADLPPESASAPTVRPETPVVTVVEPPESAPPAQPIQPDSAPPSAASKPAPLAPPAAIQGPGTVHRITLKSTDNGFVLTLKCDRPVGDTTYMNLTNPRRLVIDLRQPWKLGTRNVIRSASGVVRHVVVGEHKDRLRFVVHFRTPPKGPLAPDFQRTGNTLSVSVKTD